MVLIVVTATALTAAQVYSTIQNYQRNKLRFIDDVQQALNSSIENYFANRAKSNIMVFSSFGSDSLAYSTRASAFVQRFDQLPNPDSIKRITIKNSHLGHSWTTNLTADTIIFDTIARDGENGFKNIILNMDSSRVEELQFLTQKVMISISEDLLNIGDLYEAMEEELGSRNLNIDFALHQKTKAGKTSIGSVNGDNNLMTKATSAYLDERDSISAEFENATLIILKHGISELALSILLVGLVIGTLMHLYRTIYTQKQLAAIKDDLISNITHEFKTPIATIFSALEGVTRFNETNDPEKTKRYLALSNDQLQKLNDMVEKMLETATIDQGKLSLNKEETEVVRWTEMLVERFQMVEKQKTISFATSISSHLKMLDRFHLENALSNLIDNALKYGGENITIRFKEAGGRVIWEVEDDGGNIPSSQREKIFDKLYRIPTGNQHDVKGFGIGVYYARTIAKLHEGELTLEASARKSNFRLMI